MTFDSGALSHQSRPGTYRRASHVGMARANNQKKGATAPTIR